MTTKEFNKKRTDIWLERMSKDDARLWCMIGMKQDGTYTFMADDGLSPIGIAERLEMLAQGIRSKNSNTN